MIKLRHSPPTGWLDWFIARPLEPRRALGARLAWLSAPKWYLQLGLRENECNGSIFAEYVGLAGVELNKPIPKPSLDTDSLWRINTISCVDYNGPSEPTASCTKSIHSISRQICAVDGLTCLFMGRGWFLARLAEKCLLLRTTVRRTPAVAPHRPDVASYYLGSLFRNYKLDPTAEVFVR